MHFSLSVNIIILGACLAQIVPRMGETPSSSLHIRAEDSPVTPAALSTPSVSSNTASSPLPQRDPQFCAMIVKMLKERSAQLSNGKNAAPTAKIRRRDEAADASIEPTPGSNTKAPGTTHAPKPASNSTPDKKASSSKTSTKTSDTDPCQKLAARIKASNTKPENLGSTKNTKPISSKSSRFRREIMNRNSIPNIQVRAETTAQRTSGTTSDSANSKTCADILKAIEDAEKPKSKGTRSRRAESAEVPSSSSKTSAPTTTPQSTSDPCAEMDALLKVSRERLLKAFQGGMPKDLNKNAVKDTGKDTSTDTSKDTSKNTSKDTESSASHRI
ncbi:hypothetical protein CROQUDRAFT_681466 [Cronartium quercuum f. sp. fusiforme G11]|uniref:Uncharacterized protein n=1 Tax=Cronartium quercuum f. sp. fusiforme G11 TaxID=708437 RepID=A0A9P6N9N9_9BASI|nr:hypothetical protein CROQUDRAFT_681466 [Cronartium quercuum f. sp. fusiforme G11]